MRFFSYLGFSLDFLRLMKVVIRFVESFGIKKCTRFFSSDLPLGVKSLANF